MSLKSDLKFKFRKLKWQDYFHSYVTPREFKKGARDIPFGQGAQSLYVDGVNGNDHNDGESWKTAFKTIQAAVDAAGSWTTIYIKATTYAENITIAKEEINLTGEQVDTVIIKPASGIAILVTGNKCSVESLTGIGNGTGPAIRIAGKYGSGKELIVGNQNANGTGLTISQYYITCDGIRINQTYKPLRGIRYESYFGELKNCILEEVLGDALRLEESACKWNKIHDNTIINAGAYGIHASGIGCDYNSIYHNNIINSGTANVYDNPPNTIANKFFENYYDDHTNIDNGFGIATEPYSFTDGIDPRPVICRDGWHGLSMDSTITDLLDQLELEAIHASHIFPEDTDETITFVAGGTANTFGAWAEIVDNNAVTLSSKFASNIGHITTLAVESANTNAKIYYIEIAYGDAKTVVCVHRFKTNTGVNRFQLARMRTLKIPAGETVYYRMKCETASAQAVVNLKYHFH